MTFRDIRLSLLEAFIAFGLLGCQLNTAWEPQTQVVIDVEADDAVRSRAKSLQIVIAGSDDRDALPDAEPTFDQTLRLDTGDAARWPLRFVVKPRGKNDGRVFMLSATARGDDDAFIAQVRATSGYVMGEVRQLRLQLVAACVDVMCDATQSCAAGSCSDAWHEPAASPLFQNGMDVDAGPLDAGRDVDAMKLHPDAGHDGNGGDVDDDSGITAPVFTLDPCLKDNGGCDPLAPCQLFLTIVFCGSCPAGYDDVNGDGSQCRDRDECQTDNGGCDADHGECTNTPGGRECSCKQGFHGDGEHCSGNVPCQTKAACDVNAGCDTLDDQRVCVCKKGYEGDGASCSDVDECARHTDNCRADSVCKNNDGGFDCPCKTGFVDNKDACADLNECQANTDDCDDQPDACVNDPGGFHCSCPNGFTGDGKGMMGCSDVDECAQNIDGCASSPESCVNDPGGFHCQCPAGYQGSGMGASGCMDADECAMGADSCDHMPGACVNDAGGFHCQCPPGYSGDGQGEMGCADVDECAQHTDDCDHAPQACVNDVGGFHCACPSGYSGTGRGDGGCADVDECQAQTDDCDASPDACVNDQPGFHCKCPSGYTGDGRGSGGCVDIDECMTERGGCDALRDCVNTDGGAHCGRCADGYGTSGTTGCSACACYQHGGESACSSQSSSIPSSATRAQSGSVTAPAAALFGFQVTIPSNARVTGFGAFKQGSTQPNFRMGLYADSNGLPGIRVSRTTSVAFAASPLTLPAQNDVNGCLSGGSYWLIGFADDDLTLGQDSGAAVPTVSLTVDRSTTRDLPTSWPGGGTTSSAPASNMYVTFDQP